MNDGDVLRLDRVGACAVGLAFAGRDDPEGLRELIDMAGGNRCLLTRARARLTELGTLDEPVRRRAAALLDAAVWQLPAAGGDTVGDGPVLASS